MKTTARFLVVFLLAVGTAASNARPDDLAIRLRQLDPNVQSSEDSLREMLSQDTSQRLADVNRRSTADWRSIESRDAWEKFRDEKVEALRKSLGTSANVGTAPVTRIARTIPEDGYLIQCIVYESRPGLLVTANLYVPADVSKPCPGIVISHSHHSPKTQSELQDMGALWARAGCYVLVPDHVGHGERRQHPFVSSEDYPVPFQAGRQDYYFRFSTAAQLYVAGESLMGWMVHDLRRGVDVLLSQRGIDRKRIAILGAVAGGGDPAGVAGALDDRIQVVVPFNFGGPQPETRYPLPDDAEEWFRYAGGGSWESTRNLHRSASDGFLPWVIVGSVAPRGLIHAHEFAWDQPRDPVWKRYERIFGFYDARNRLDFAHGHGLLRERPPQASHCTNIGRAHRKRLHDYFAEHWDINVNEEQPVTRRTAEELACLKDERTQRLLKPVHALAAEMAETHAYLLGAKLDARDAAEVRRLLQDSWTDVLGEVTPPNPLRVEPKGDSKIGEVRLERQVLHGERAIRIPLLLLIPSKRGNAQPVIALVAQGGKDAFLKERSTLIAALLEHSAVCLIDVRGTGESAAGRDRGRRSEATSLAASELMLGEPRLAGQLRDLRAALQYLRTRQEFGRVAVFGDSTAEANAPDAVVRRPLDVEQPALAEPLGGTLALLAGLFEQEPTVIAARGGLVSFASILESPFVHVPFDAIVPGATAAGDLPAVTRAVASRHPIRIAGLVDGTNRAADTKAVRALYGEAGAGEAGDEAFAAWLVKALTAPQMNDE